MVVKAVLAEGDGETIVGAAQWRFVVGREREGVAGVSAGAGEDGNPEKKEEAIGKLEEGDETEKKDAWGIGANVKFCEDVFLVADEHMIRSTQGRDYASEFSNYLTIPFQLPNTLLIKKKITNSDSGKNSQRSS